MDSLPEEPANWPIRKKSQFQFNLKTMLIWTAVAAVFFAIVTLAPILIVPIALGCPVAISGFLMFQCLQDEVESISFNVPWQVASILLVSIHSTAMLAMATNVFVSEWQGSKGNHWFYYFNDAEAGSMTFPIFVAGAVSFGCSVIQPRIALQSPTNLALIATNAAICWWYTIATIFLGFAQGARILAVVPLIAALNYSCYSALIIKHVARRWKFQDLKSIPLAGWFICLITTILVKIPLAQSYYASLPTNPPNQNCFIVTAASRGHRWLVGSFQEATTGRTINRQLCVFWDFESWMQTNLPDFHRCLRAVYNRLGPFIARMIYYRWQADFVFLLLLPLQFALRLLGFGTSQTRVSK